MKKRCFVIVLTIIILITSVVSAFAAGIPASPCGASVPNGVLGAIPDTELFMLGDADDNGEVESIDAAVIQYHLIGIPIVDTVVEQAADVDLDGDITIIDVTWILRFLVQIPVVYPIGTVADSVMIFSQQNPSVTRYLSEVSYDGAEPSHSAVKDYAYASVDYRKDRPLGATITIPRDGTLTVCDDRHSMTCDVSAGSFTVENLTPGVPAVAQLSDKNDEVVSTILLMAEDPVRMINGGGSTFNIRDLGGWRCDGGTLKYGLIFRGCELNGDSYNIVLNDRQKELFTDFLQIRDEIDMRGDAEVDGSDMIFGTDDDITDSALGEKADYVRYPAAPYHVGLDLNNSYQKAYYAAMIRRVASDVRSDRPCYLHCLAGADRTGTFCALIEAICGVSLNDIEKEFELTSFSAFNLRQRSDETWIEMLRVINALPGDTFRDKAITYALRTGVTIEEINTLRRAMISGNPAPIELP